MSPFTDGWIVGRVASSATVIQRGPCVAAEHTVILGLGCPGLPEWFEEPGRSILGIGAFGPPEAEVEEQYDYWEKQ